MLDIQTDSKSHTYERLFVSATFINDFSGIYLVRCDERRQKRDGGVSNRM